MILIKKILYTLQDYTAFNFFYMKSRLIWTPILIVIIFPAVTTVIGMFQGDPEWLTTLFSSLFIIVLLAGVMTVLSVLSIRRAAKKQYQSSKAMRSESELTADETGLKEKSEHGCTIVKWEDVLKATESDTAVYLFFSRMQAFLIPKRLLTVQEDETLRALVRSHLPQEKIQFKPRG